MLTAYETILPQNCFPSSFPPSFQTTSNELTFKNNCICRAICRLIIAYDKQTVNNSFLVAFFTRTCHVILMKTIAYVTVTLNKNIIERHKLFDSLFSTIIKIRAVSFGDMIADRKQWVWMTISNNGKNRQVLIESVHGFNLFTFTAIKFIEFQYHENSLMMLRNKKTFFEVALTKANREASASKKCFDDA